MRGSSQEHRERERFSRVDESHASGPKRQSHRSYRRGDQAVAADRVSHVEQQSLVRNLECDATAEIVAAVFSVQQFRQFTGRSSHATRIHRVHRSVAKQIDLARQFLQVVLVGGTGRKLQSHREDRGGETHRSPALLGESETHGQSGFHDSGLPSQSVGTVWQTCRGDLSG